jgi:tetratricopeptide (TPR) repeat protein
MRRFGLVLSVALVASPALAAGHTTVAVAPLVSGAPAEHQWIGSAMAAALVTRVALQPELNAVTVRQLTAAMRDDNLDPATVTRPAVAEKVGRLVGADVILVGSYEPRGVDLELSLTVYHPFAKVPPHSWTVKGKLEALVDLEAQVAVGLAAALGAQAPNAAPGAFGTRSLAAWRSVTLATSVLDWQSFSPHAADPKTELTVTHQALEQSRIDAMKGAQLDPEFGEAWSALGMVQALLGDTQSAWRSFGKATALGFGHHPSAIVGAAFVRMREGRPEDAAKILASAIARRPGFLLARGYLGELYAKLGRYQDALAVYDAYAELAPHQPWVLSQRGYVKSKLGDTRGALADSLAAVELVPDSAAFLVQLASRYIDEGKLVGAEDALRHAVSIYPDETRAHVRLGYVYLLQGKDELAVSASTQALALAKKRSGPRDVAYAHLNLARAFGHLGKLDEAFSHLEAARAAGVPSLDELRTDARLAALRADPRWQKLNP